MGAPEDNDESTASATTTTTKAGWSEIFWVGTGVEEFGERPEGRWWGGRETYRGAFIFNIGSFILPGLYNTLSKLWLAEVDPGAISIAETYNYIGIVVEVINEGLPRASYKVIGDKSRRTRSQRIGISIAMVLFQLCLGLLMSIIICSAAPAFTKSFVPKEVRSKSVEYVRIGAFSAFFSAMDVSVSACTRALDRPDVPLLISTVKTGINIILDILFVSRYRVSKGTATVNVQGIIRLCCDASGALIGLLYFIYISGLIPFRRFEAGDSRKPNFAGLMLMVKPGSYTFVESAVRNALYMWLITGIVSLGNVYNTAFTIFNAIRWGLVMVPVYALEVTSLTFVGHAWGAFKARCRRQRHATNHDLLLITRPALLSSLIALAVEIPLCLIMSFKTAYPFALYISNSDPVARITAHMWRTIDWCYIFYAVTTQLAAILLATRPRWYLYQSLMSNLLYVLPWAIVVQVKGLKSGDPWMWHALVFGGSMVFTAGAVGLMLTLWARELKGGVRTWDGDEEEEGEREE
ncbi:hypothetical protein BDD12DRAFT_872447 [Trichophaea hybrida]|nr:hypothetical protein BDD12DRAFT_872447 [Trichophaea hybrida]